jgi:hypothetical protein
VAAPMAAEAATATATRAAVVDGGACQLAQREGTRAVVVWVVAAWAEVVRETADWAVPPEAAGRLPLSAQTAAQVKRATSREEGRVVAADLAGAVSATNREARPVAPAAAGNVGCCQAVAWAATAAGAEAVDLLVEAVTAAAVPAGATVVAAMVKVEAR